MIIKQEDFPEKEAYGVKFKTLATGDKIMCTIMLHKKDGKVPEHKHPAEQVGYVVKGKFKLFIEGKEDGILEAGDSYVVKGNLIHAMEVLEDSEVIDMFSPPREEYRNK